MDAQIIEAIQHIKAKKKKASIDLILYKLKRDNNGTNIEDLKRYFDKLESCGVIVNKKPNTELGSYVVNEEKRLAESFVDNDVVIVLKEEIGFLKDEIKQKNLTIKKLLALNEIGKAHTGYLQDFSAFGKGEIAESCTSGSDLLTQDGNCKTKDSAKLVSQLEQIREENHKRFLEMKEVKEMKQTNDEESEKDDEEKEMGKNDIIERNIKDSYEKRLVKKRNFPNYHGDISPNYLTDENKHLILHAPSSHLLNKSDNRGISEQLLRLKNHIEKNIPHTTVFLS